MAIKIRKNQLSNAYQVGSVALLDPRALLDYGCDINELVQRRDALEPWILTREEIQSVIEMLDISQFVKDFLILCSLVLKDDYMF